MSCTCLDRDPQEADSFGWTALMIAALFGHTECVRRLLPVSDARAVAELEWTASTIAAHCGKYDIADLIERFIESKEEQAELESLITPTENKNKKGDRL